MLFVITPVYCQLALADIFSDNMVLQRENPITVWGSAAPGVEVVVCFKGKDYSTVANTKGNWLVKSAKQPADSQPQQLLVKSSGETITLENILIGDVWLLLGQSNMEWPMAGEMHYNQQLETANNPRLRFYNPRYIGKNIYRQDFDREQKQKLAEGELFLEQRWQVSDTASFKTMSAVGYYFGQEIVNSQGIPVGLINLSIGGAPLETFLAEETLRDREQFSSKVNTNWLKNHELPIWIRERGEQNLGKQGINSGSTSNHAYKPGFAYAAGIAPLLNMPIKGILWYQGESNAQEMERVDEYPELQKLLIEDYRKKWRNPQLPFYWVQLSSIDTTNYASHLWPEFRDGQRRLLGEMEHVGMAVSSDIGNRNDVHPRNKMLVGKRLARWALNQQYEEDILVSGPLPEKAQYINGNIIVDFKYSGNGLKTSDGKVLKGFLVDGRAELSAEIKGDKVIIWSSDISSDIPDYIYYNWEPYGTGNLINSDNLPASTFKMKVVEGD